MEDKTFDLLEKIYLELQGTRKELKSEIQQNREKIETNTKEIKENRKAIEANTEAIKENRKAIKANAEGIKANGQSIKRLEIKIEEEISDKIRGLYDSKEVTNDRLNNIENKIDKLQIDVNYLAIKTILNNTGIIEISKKLENVE
ncbi:hypothetical protein [Sporosalibacterium faouarense]|uniref:hypothetical protein n=1 Tax=Sporosalibacterium faouarense TaxID=516123 RepID=UPI00192B75EC|nr:hypothetical protein [Sporosalibacterium faouarense]